MFDVAVIGLGPAGRVLASRCAVAGMTTLAIDPDPHCVWARTLSLWGDQLPSWLSRDVCASWTSAPSIIGRSSNRLHRPYVVLDNARLQQELPIDDVTVEPRSIPDDEVKTLDTRARVVVDCRGARSSGALQVAYGIVVNSEDALPALDGHDALFMDWRDDYSPDDVADHTFLYAFPMGGGRTLLEETALATSRLTDPLVLERRLLSRLRARGVKDAVLARPLTTERVKFPLRTEPKSGSAFNDEGFYAFGTAGGYGHAATGYSIGAVLEAADTVAGALAEGKRPGPPRSRLSTALHRLGLRALLRLDADATTDLFESFGQLAESRQQWFVDSDVAPGRVAAAMAEMWLRMPRASMWKMVRASFY